MFGWRHAISSFFLLGVIGCAPEEVVVKPESPPPSETIPAVEAVSVKTTLLGEEAIKISSIGDKFTIVLPGGFRGTVLTADEIDRFSNALSKASAQLGSQVKSQCNALRPAGGVLFALNVLPASVTNGFADNMNIAVRGSVEVPTTEKTRASVAAELEKLSPNSTLTVTELPYLGKKMLEFKVVGIEGNAERKIDITRLIYVAFRDNQVFTLTYACPTSQAPKVSPSFRASALSLSFD